MPRLAVPFPAGQASGSGRFRCRLSSRPLPQCPRAPAAVAGVHSGDRLRVGCGRRPRVHCPHSGPEVSAGGADLARNLGRPRNRTPSSVRWTSGTAARCRPDGRCPPRTRPQAPEQGRGYGGRRRPTVHARPAGHGSGPRPPHTVSTAQHNLDAGGCPDQGVRRTACRSLRTRWQCPRCVRNCGRLAMVSGRLVSTVDTAAACGVAAATGSGRRTGGC
jgi:hypothetical protein